MSYYGLTEAQRKNFHKKIVQTVYVDGDHYKYGNFAKGDGSLSEEYNNITKVEDDKEWYRIDAPTARRSSVLYTPTEKWYYGLARVLRYPDKLIQASKTNGFEGIMKDTQKETLKWMDKQLEYMVIQGPYVNGSNDTNYGLYNLAGNTTTYDTVKFATATGVTKAVEAMIILCEADGFYGPYDLVVYSGLKQYVARQVRNAYTDRKEKDELGEMGIENIYYSDQMPSATEDGSMILLQKTYKGDPTYEVKYLDEGFAPVGPLVWEPSSYSWAQLVAGHFTTLVYHPNAICTHTSVDLA